MRADASSREAQIEERAQQLGKLGPFQFVVSVLTPATTETEVHQPSLLPHIYIAMFMPCKSFFFLVYGKFPVFLRYFQRDRNRM